MRSGWFVAFLVFSLVPASPLRAEDGEADCAPYSPFNDPVELVDPSLAGEIRCSNESAEWEALLSSEIDRFRLPKLSEVRLKDEAARLEAIGAKVLADHPGATVEFTGTELVSKKLPTKISAEHVASVEALIRDRFQGLLDCQVNTETLASVSCLSPSFLVKKTTQKLKKNLLPEIVWKEKLKRKVVLGGCRGDERFTLTSPRRILTLRWRKAKLKTRIDEDMVTPADDLVLKDLELRQFAELVPEKKFASLYVEFVANRAHFENPEEANQALAEFAQFMKEHPEQKIKLIGVTDSTLLERSFYFDGANRQMPVKFKNLAKSRALKVRDELVRLGVSPRQITEVRGAAPGTRIKLGTMLKRMIAGQEELDPHNRRIDVIFVSGKR